MIEFDIRPTDHPVPDTEREEKLQAPGFGQLFTDHMITLRWSADSGWHDGRLEPYGLVLKAGVWYVLSDGAGSGRIHRVSRIRSIELTGGPQGALYVFIFFYLTCIALTWWYYARKNAPMPC